MPPDVDAGSKSLVELPRDLVEGGYVSPDKEPPKYRDCYEAATSACIPAKRVRGRWYVHPRDYPAIAAVLCPRAEPVALPAAPAPRAIGRRRAPTLPSAA